MFSEYDVYIPGEKEPPVVWKPFVFLALLNAIAGYFL